MPRLYLFTLLVLQAVLLTACTEPPPPTINLYRAIHIGDWDQVKRHLYRGADLTERDPEGNLPLHVAARDGRLVIARSLVEHGADPNAANDSGQTPVLIALANGKIKLGEMLMKHGADDDPQALLFALAEQGVADRDGITFLLGEGVDIDALNGEGRAALHIAVANDLVLLATRLVRAGADINRPDSTGRSPLALALEKDRPSEHIVELLQQYGASAVPVLE